MEFTNPFATPINLASVPILATHLDDTDALTIVAEFYFKRGYYSEALEIFNILIKQENPSAQLYQKTGYCLQQNGLIDEALNMYSRSELLYPDSQWGLRRIAQCHKLLGHSQDALNYYRKVAEKKPNDINLALSMGHCELDLKNYAEALKHYFKVEYLSPESGKALRPIAWCLFLTGAYERSASYYTRILDNTPDVTDYINFGHLSMATGKYNDAKNYYSQARNKSTNKSTDEFWQQLQNDRQYLISAGVDSIIIDIVFDSVSNDI